VPVALRAGTDAAADAGVDAGAERIAETAPLALPGPGTEAVEMEVSP
jgi:hypothetical protein